MVPKGRSQTLQPKRPYYGGSRKPTGTLIRNKSGFSAKIWAEVDGERIRITKSLGTDIEAVAKKKLARLLAEGDPAKADATAVETFAAAAVRVNADRAKAGIKTTKDEMSRLKRFAFPELGDKLVTAIKTRHVNAALDAVREAGRAQQTAQHVKQAIANVFAELKREGVVETNPAKDAELPTYRKALKKTRAVLNASELQSYLAWEHPDENFAEAVRERQTMSCVSLCFGGLRTSDLHALRWRHLNAPGFEWGFALRQKTARPQPIRIPAVLRPVLLDWWERSGRPGKVSAADLDKPVFPTRRDGRGGSKAGAAKGKGSHAEALRLDLRRAFGIDVLKPVTKKRKNGRPLTRPQWVTVRKLTERERDLLEGTDEIQPVDFHSWRRAFRQALDGAQVDAATAQMLGGWESNQDSRYAVNPDTMVEIPAVALPAKLLLGTQK